MKTLTQKILDSYNPCYPASRYYGEDYKGDILQLAQDPRIPFEDRLWVIMRPELVSDKLMRLFAVWCARQVRRNNQDPRVKRALDVAVAYVFGEATEEQLAEASKGACNAALAADKAAYSAAVSAADATDSVAPVADSADSIAHVAYSAAYNAARSVAYSASGTFYSDEFLAAFVGAQKAQEKQLIAMILAGVETGDVK